ncbi:NigD-like protein [Mariniphaga anaerophila]|uniref:NigD-like protein n=1 Tax=Mariniphaga anaerophila TaxID=1484053 RepID=A0A1M4VFF5_9BACT|nr:NigD-like C-terminal domain-containing protein [Mariniphaga anaerophila]SHE67632.1 NigD-like protein [Mariniphaga anaerophila]
MRNLFILFVLFTVFFVSCQEEEDLTFQETGVVVDYSGMNYCGFVIELDNGTKIQPHNYPKDFEFVQGQRILVDYVMLPNIISTCDKGTACDILNVQELTCGSPVTDLYANNYDSLANDPVQVYEATANAGCLHLKLSFSGGCREHVVNLARIHQENQDGNNIPVLEIRHDAKDDLCEMWLTREMQFDLSALQDEGAKQFYLKALLTNGETYLKLIDIE